MTDADAPLSADAGAPLSDYAAGTLAGLREGPGQGIGDELGTGAVAGFAAVVSYTHIYDLGRLYGQQGAAAGCCR